MAKYSSYDTLTTLPDRESFLACLRNELVQETAQPHQSALLLIDLDDFNDINRLMGHHIGDVILKEVAARLKDSMREHDMLARISGDEFALLTRHVGQLNEMEALASRLLRIIARPYLTDEKEVMLHCSIGIALFVSDGRDVSNILNNAETALYRAKAGGKNTYQHFAVEMNTSIQRQHAISQALQQSVHSELSDFYLEYQPRLDLASGAIIGVEALLRWNSPKFGELSPGEFIPIAEQNGTIIELGEWVLFQACQSAVAWQQELGCQISMAVNLSARQFRDVNFAQTVEDTLHKTGLPAQQLELELTESMLMYDLPKTLEILHALKNIGIRLAVDDFGTGYSSLSYLKDFPLDYLKIDRSFISHLPVEYKEKAIVQTIIGMAHLLGLKVIAEGVETRQQLHFLLGQDCDEMQGFLFSRPVSDDKIVDLLSRKNEGQTLLQDSLHF